MRSQYPYKLQVIPELSPIKDENGDFVSNTPEWLDVAKCRDETGRNYVVNTPDGAGYVSTVTIFAPKGTTPLSPGTIVRVLDGDVVRATGKIVASRKEFFHTRIWL
jgi:hypothetical protein